MDHGKLAQDLTGLLVPCLPYLADAGTELAKETAARVGREGFRLGRDIWDKLHRRLTATPAGLEAVNRLATAPADAAARSALCDQVRAALGDDVDVAHELGELLEYAPLRRTACGRPAVLALEMPTPA
jgi:hypothetical protein